MFFYRTHLGIDVCFFSSRYRYSGRGVRYVFLRSVRIFSPPARESCGRFSNSKELIQRSFDALAFRRSRYGNSEKELVRICFLFLMNSCYKVFEIECSLYCYVQLQVLSHSKYRFLFHAVYIGIMTGIVNILRGSSKDSTKSAYLEAFMCYLRYGRENKKMQIQGAVHSP